ncbi:FAD-binding domain-containing protein [Glonium stellatum]|uniref:FAD-binding domain-containing protein n=1 Tax=Glonium stellatum TaxID=574774 RepID=A0A8E2JR42_9PEZI|nr:FAD-binding domain-containing protein [Glonium stellatum]
MVTSGPIRAISSQLADSKLQSALTTLLPEKTHLPGSDGYTESNGSYFAAFENEVTPSYIARPSGVEDVSSLVKVLKPLAAREECKIAVRGGGHTAWAGSANIKDGVTIDMRALRGISLNADKTLVRIGAGESWESVYKELETHGLTVAGGRVGKVGVTGLVVGGGLSYFSTARGFVCDSVVDFEVVLASGDVVHANARENPDLWWALKGGLNNFGIVTSFEMKTFESQKMWGGIIYYLPDAFPQHIQAAYDYATAETPDEDTHLICSAGYGYGHQVVTTLVYHTKGEENPPPLQPFTAIQPQIDQMTTLRSTTHLGLCDEISKVSHDGDRQYYITCTIRPDVALMNSIYQMWQATLASLKEVPGFIFSVGFQPLTKALFQNSASAGGNPQGLSPSDAPLFIVLLSPVWSSPADDSRVIGEVGKLLEDIKQLASEKGLLHRYIFTNYAFSDQDVFKGYGEESVARLREASKKWDPEGFFQHGVPGGFKLSNTQ